MSFPAPLSLLYVKKKSLDHSANQLCSASLAGNSESKAGSQEQEAATEKQQEKLKPELHPKTHDDGKEEEKMVELLPRCLCQHARPKPSAVLKCNYMVRTPRPGT